MLASKFIEAELTSYIHEQRLTESPLMVKLISRAFEAYDEYRKLVSASSPVTLWNCGPYPRDDFVK